VTHYHLADKRPFLNLSDLNESDLARVLEDMLQRRQSGRLQRVFGARYMALRRLTEAWLRALFINAGGCPQRSGPHYFVLGSSSWYRGLSPDMRAVTMTLSDLPATQTSVTYPDSFTAMGFLPDFGLPYRPRPYHGTVFRLDELPELVRRYGIPPDAKPANYTGYQLRPFEQYIEVQLWADEPLRQLVDR
jgi:hypothetical protein